MPPTVTKAVITAAGRGTRQYPATNVVQKELLPLVDRDGITKPVIQIIVEEALAAGIEHICVVTRPGADADFRAHFRPLTDTECPAFAGKDWALAESDKLARMQDAICYAYQKTQEGYGHAVYQARDFVGDEPFLLMLGDHVYVSEREKNCARQLLDVFEEHQASVSSVQRTPESQLHLFGTIAGHKIADNPPTYEVTRLYEKPTPEYAREHLRIEGLPEGEYLTFFGMHVFEPQIFDCLGEQIANDVRQRGEIQLTAAQDLLRSCRRYLACQIAGQRYDMGVPEGLVASQIGLALAGRLRDRVLAQCSPDGPKA